MMTNRQVETFVITVSEINKLIDELLLDSSNHTNDEVDQNFKKASNNLPRISLLNQKGINVLDLITYEKIFIEEASIAKISERLL